MTRTLTLCLATALLTAACAEDGGHSANADESSYTEQYIESSDVWTYISLGDGKVVGTSPLGDAEADQAWSRRTDWDFATCGDLIRTNGGTSGSGRGALRLSAHSFDGLAIPDAELLADVDTIEVW